jgi:deazaflavin-dependent oxidoreductase (nitroreductase family)
MPMSFNQLVIEEFRANGGKVGGPFEGGDLLLLTTTGAKSGEEHTVPLGYVLDGDLLLVVASAAGAPSHPAWYHNLLAHPMARVEIGTERFQAIAVPAEGARRDRLFARVVRAAPGYADYQARVPRRADRRSTVGRGQGRAPPLPHRAAPVLDPHQNHRRRRAAHRAALRHGRPDLRAAEQRLVIRACGPHQGPPRGEGAAGFRHDGPGQPGQTAGRPPPAPAHATRT